MAVQTFSKKSNKSLEIVLEELRDIKEKISKLVLSVPEESLRDYEKPSDIRRAFLRASAKHTPR